MRSTNLSLLGTLGSAIILTACSGFQLEKAERMQPSTDAYNMALQQGYLDLSASEYGEADYPDSDFFAERSMAAGANQRPAPQSIGERNLPADKADELAEARSRLAARISEGAVDMVPQAAAQAQLNFDCWMQEQEENNQPDDIAACREGFETAMGEIDAAFAPAAGMPEREVFDVVFDFDSDDLSPEAMDRLAAVVTTVQTYENPVVTVLGNADQVGATDYNVALSERRANAVAEELKANGVEVDAVIGRGDQAPAVDNPDRRPEELNRRALIVIREGEG